MASKDTTVALPADSDDAEDFPVSAAGVERALMGRSIRMLRNRLKLTQEGFAERYGIPVAAIRQYEIGRNMPPPAVRAYLAVIEQEPDVAAEALRRSAA